MSCDFCGGSHCSVLIRIILYKKRLIIWAIKEDKVVSQVITRIICLKDRGTIRIKALGRNKMKIHLTDNLLINNNNNFLQLKTG